MSDSADVVIFQYLRLVRDGGASRGDRGARRQVIDLPEGAPMVTRASGPDPTVTVLTLGPWLPPRGNRLWCDPYLMSKRSN